MGIFDSVRRWVQRPHGAEADLILVEKSLFALAQSCSLEIENSLAATSLRYSSFLKTREGKFDSDHFLTVALVTSGLQALSENLHEDRFRRAVDAVFAPMAVPSHRLNEIERYVIRLRERWNVEGRGDSDQLLDRILAANASNSDRRAYALAIGHWTLESLSSAKFTEAELLPLASLIGRASLVFSDRVAASLPREGMRR